MKTTIQIIAIILLQSNLFAQSIKIYRAGTYIATVDTFLQNAINIALPNDSLVLSADTFSGFRIRIDKNLVLKGTQTATDSTIIRSNFPKRAIFYVQSKSLLSSPTIVSFRDVIVQDATLDCTGVTVHPAADSLYGAGLRAFENTDVTITGNSIFRNCGINGHCLYAITFPDSLYYHGGAAIFSAGKLTIAENTTFNNNIAFMFGGGGISSFKELIIQDNVLFDSNIAYKGSAILARGKVTIKDKVKFFRNYTAMTGIIYMDHGQLTLQDSVQIIGNTCYAYVNDSSASIGANYSDITLKNKAVVAGNVGGRILLYASNLYLKDSAVIALNSSYQNYAAGIYNKGGNLYISGGQIIGNYDINDSSGGKGMAIFNDTIQGKPAPILSIANARIFNPTQNAKRTIEVYNETGTMLHSDSTWWGESDTSALIYNNGSASTVLSSWIVADWSVNKGVPAGSFDTTFPVEAYFKLNSGAAIPPSMFWMLKGLYACNHGTFSPDTADMMSTNFISTMYKSSDTTRLVNIVATVDADTFFNSQIVTGLSITDRATADKNFFEIFPNPATTSVTIKAENCHQTTSLKVYDLLGKIMMQKELLFKNNTEQIQTNFPEGLYIIELSRDEFSDKKSLIIK